LDNATKGTTTSQAVNKTGYLTALSKLPINTDEDISDLKKARVLMKSIINSDPKNPKGWVAAARVEELDGKLAIAR
jgi:pre-mRNA-processing factor 6